MCYKFWGDTWRGVFASMNKNAPRCVCVGGRSEHSEFLSGECSGITPGPAWSLVTIAGKHDLHKLPSFVEALDSVSGTPKATFLHNGLHFIF